MAITILLETVIMYFFALIFILMAMLGVTIGVHNIRYKQALKKLEKEGNSDVID